MRLRVFRDGDYFQFVTAVVPGPEFRPHVGRERDVRPGQLWLAIAKQAGHDIEDAVRRGEIPLPNPIDAFAVFPNVEAALRDAPHLKEAQVGRVVYEFSL